MVSKQLQEIFDIIDAPMTEDERAEWERIGAREAELRKYADAELIEMLDTDWSKISTISHAELLEQLRLADERDAS